MGFLGNLLNLGSTQKIDIEELKSRNVLLLDVRSPGEFKTGSVKGATNIPVDTIGSQIAKIKKMNRPVLTFCASGMRSGNAASKLKAAGIEAYNGGPWNSVAQMIG